MADRADGRRYDLRFTPDWAVGYWFIPILNIVRPKQILDDLWRATDAKADASQGAWRTLPASTLVAAFWALSLVSSAVAIYATQTASQTVAELQHRNSAYLATHVLEVVTGLVLFRLVGVLTIRQDRRATARGTLV